MANKKNALASLLAEQGFGTRKECAKLVWAGAVEYGYGNVEWIKAEKPEAEIAEQLNLHFRVLLNGEIVTLPYLKELYLAFHKPVDTECSHSPSHYQSVFAFFPEPFINRGLQAVGRLDADTTGLLLLSDSGPFNHYFTSPKRHIAKTYRVGTKHPVSPEQIKKIELGVELKDEEEKTRPAKLKLLGENLCDLTIEEGRYHQVKRMFGAVSNRVESIHRIAIGGYSLPETLKHGSWKILEHDDLLALGFRIEAN